MSTMRNMSCHSVVTMAPPEDSPVQSRKTSPTSSPSSSVYGGTSNPSQPASEPTEGPSLKKRSKPAVILSKVKKSFTSTIAENVANRDAGGRSVAMVKGIISSLTGGSSQSNVPMATTDTATVAITTESNSSDVPPAAGLGDAPMAGNNNDGIINDIIILLYREAIHIITCCRAINPGDTCC